MKCKIDKLIVPKWLVILSELKSGLPAYALSRTYKLSCAYVYKVMEFFVTEGILSKEKKGRVNEYTLTVKGKELYEKGVAFVNVMNKFKIAK